MKGKIENFIDLGKYKTYYTNKKGKEINYLDEEVLGVYLQHLFPGKEIIHNKQFSKEIKSRPDYRINDIKLIVEFDGYQHFTSSMV